MINQPTIQQLKEQISKDLRNRLGISDDQLKKVLDAFSAVIAAQFKLNYLALSDVQKNLYPDTADTSANGGSLDRLGRIYLNRDIRPAISGVFNLLVVGDAGSVLRAGITFKSNEGSLNAGKLYILENEYILTGTNDIIQVRSLGGGGEFALLENNSLTITEPVIGVEQTVSVDSIETEPVEAESVNDYRTSIIRAIQLEPQGGAKIDYILWANDAAGVRKVYPYLKDSDAGTIQIFTESTDETVNGVPTQAILDDVEEVINFDPDDSKPLEERGRRPMQANLEVLPINPVPIQVNITGLEKDTAEIRDSIFDNLKEYISTVRPFIDGADLLRNKNDILFAAKIQGVVLDVLEDGNFFSNLELLVDSSVQTSFAFSRENIPYLQTVNYS